jgi:H+-translocating NAD(P) transhydrogenase subunit alpha
MNSHTQQVVIGVLAEGAIGERRVALIPSDTKRLFSRAKFLVESGAGREAGFDDHAYVEAGARIAESQDILEKCDVILKVRQPPVDEVPRAGRVFVSLGGRDSDLVDRLRKRSVIHLPLERIPRITRAQAMDVVSSQASIAGYASVLEGARALSVLLPTLTTAAGTIKPAKMIALRVGVAGYRRMPARVGSALWFTASMFARPLASRWKVWAPNLSQPVAGADARTHECTVGRSWRSVRQTLRHG